MVLGESLKRIYYFLCILIMKEPPIVYLLLSFALLLEEFSLTVVIMLSFYISDANNTSGCELSFSKTQLFLFCNFFFFVGSSAACSFLDKFP